MCYHYSQKNYGDDFMFDNILTPQEFFSLSLRNLYSLNNYSFYRMSRFEDYDFYAEYKNFLYSNNILTFTDPSGTLKALRPDVTLSIIKNAKPGKYCYAENVYRVPANTNSFREFSQTGIEYLGCPRSNISEVLMLAVKSLEILSEGRRISLSVADAGEVLRLSEGFDKNEIVKCLAAKNIHGLKELNAPQELISLAEFDRAVTKNNNIIHGRISQIMKQLQDFTDKISIDFSAVSKLMYYDGIVFKGYIEGIPYDVLSGGEYSVMGKSGAGFAVYLDRMEAKIHD